MNNDNTSSVYLDAPGRFPIDDRYFSHQDIFQWFDRHRKRVLGWFGPLPEGERAPLLVRAQGNYPDTRGYHRRPQSIVDAARAFEPLPDEGWLPTATTRRWVSRPDGTWDLESGITSSKYRDLFSRDSAPRQLVSNLSSRAYSGVAGLASLFADVGKLRSSSISQLASAHSKLPSTSTPRDVMEGTTMPGADQFIGELESGHRNDPLPSEDGWVVLKIGGMKPVPYEVEEVVKDADESTSGEKESAIQSALEPSERFRLRSRGRVTRVMEKRLLLTEGLVSFAETGGKTSSGAVGSFFRVTFGDRVRPVDARVIHGDHDDGDKSSDGSSDSSDGEEDTGPPVDVLVSVIVRGQAEVLRVSLSVLTRLVVYMAHRPRHTGTALLLRTKAAQYAKECNLKPEYLAFTIQATVILAMMIPNTEHSSWMAIKGSEGEAIVNWSERVRRGVLRDESFEQGLADGVLKGIAYLGLTVLIVFVLAKLHFFTWLSREVPKARYEIMSFLCKLFGVEDPMTGICFWYLPGPKLPAWVSGPAFLSVLSATIISILLRFVYVALRRKAVVVLPTV